MLASITLEHAGQAEPPTACPKRLAASVVVSSLIGVDAEPRPHLLDRRLQGGAVEAVLLPLLEHQLRRVAGRARC